MSESDEQKAIVSWFRDQYPDHAKALRASMSGINYGSKKRAYMMNQYTKAMGRVQGEADLAILLPRGGYGCLLIEHKAEGETKGLTPEQIDYLNYNNEEAGNCAISTEGIGMAMQAIQQYMSQPPTKREPASKGTPPDTSPRGDQ